MPQDVNLTAVRHTLQLQGDAVMLSLNYDATAPLLLALGPAAGCCLCCLHKLEVRMVHTLQVLPAHRCTSSCVSDDTPNCTETARQQQLTVSVGEL
jgi:hypothetical protein